MVFYLFGLVFVGRKMLVLHNLSSIERWWCLGEKTTSGQALSLLNEWN